MSNSTIYVISAKAGMTYFSRWSHLLLFEGKPMVKLPGNPKSITKIDVIRNHLSASIQMIAMDINQASVHVIVMACEEMIGSLAKQHKIVLPVDHRYYIKEDHYKEYRRDYLRYSYNYFKHSDKDAKLDYNGPNSGKLEKINELQTFMNVKNFVKLNGNLDHHFSFFTGYIFLLYPEYLKKNAFEDHPQLKSVFERLGDCTKSTSKEALRISLCQQGILPSVPFS